MPQQPQRERPGRTLPTTARLLRGAALAGSLALLPLGTACGAGGAGSAAEREPRRTSVPHAQAVDVVAPAKVEVIAALTGCTAEIRVEAAELREGLCHTKKGDYLITTFPEEKYQRTWLDTASVYGGTYLVGSRWVVSAAPKLLEQFRPKLGGTIQKPRGTDAAPAPRAS